MSDPDHDAPKVAPRRGGARPGAGRPRRADADDRILDVTIDLLDRVGYGALRVDDVADEADMAKSTVYRRWSTKAALVAAAVERLYLDQVAVPDTGTVRRDLCDLLNDSYRLLIAGRGRVFASLIRESGTSPEITTLVRQTMHARRRFYMQVLNRGIARGEIPPDVDVGLAIDLVLGPLWVRQLVTGEPISPDAVDRIVDAVLDGIATGGAAS